MRVKSKKFALIAASIIMVLAVPLIIFHSRSPVLILTEQSLLRLYGEDRIRSESFRSSLSLFRPVKTVVVANDSGDDIVQYAVAEASSRPYFVLFPSRFVRSAEIYHNHNPGNRIILMETSNSAGNFVVNAQNDSHIDFFTFRSDVEADFYRAGYIAAMLDLENTGRNLVFLHNSVYSQGRSAFLRAQEDQNKPQGTQFFTNYSAQSGNLDFSCVIIAGAGYEFVEEEHGIPVILFSWLNPPFLPSDVVLVVNDSPWALTVQAVRLAESGAATGNIPSKLIITDTGKVSRYMLEASLRGLEATLRGLASQGPDVSSGGRDVSLRELR